MESSVHKKTLNSSECLIPFSSIHISPDGSYRLCSSNIHKMFSMEEGLSLQEAWGHSRYQDIREQMLSDQKPRMCEGACYSQEKKGLFSKRQKFNQNKNKEWSNGAIELKIDSPVLRYVDVAFSNICNLKCVMCSSHYSSAWVKWDESAKTEKISFRHEPSSVRSLRPEIVDEMLELSPQLFGMFIKGGEPFADEQCLHFLRSLAAKKNDLRKEFSIFIQTNGTLATPQIFAAMENLSLDIGISLDGIEQTYEWVRGFPFAKLDENIKRFAQENTVRSLMFHFTLSAYNLFNIEETINYFFKLKKIYPSVDRFFFSGIVRQEWGNVFSVPLIVRKEVAGRLRESPYFSSKDVVGMESVLRVLERDEPRESYFYSTCKQWMEFCERMRGKKLSEVDSRYGAIFSGTMSQEWSSHT